MRADSDILSYVYVYKFKGGTVAPVDFLSSKIYIIHIVFLQLGLRQSITYEILLYTYATSLELLDDLI